MTNIFLSMAISRIEQCEDLQDIRDALASSSNDVDTQRLVNAIDRFMNNDGCTFEQVYMIAFYILHIERGNE